jgi:predicted amidohydrolase YtcJ
LGSRGAALIDDYSDDKGNRGLLVTEPAALDAAIAKAQRCKIQIAVHAIGDRGNRSVLDAFAKALNATPDKGALRWRIEHAQVVALSDIPRFASLGIIASMQPTHATSDMPWAEQRVGASRIAGAYAWRKFRDAGVRLALGSDFPVESVDPLLGLYSAITREDRAGKPAEGWYANERLTAWEALRGFTLDAAYAGFDEARLGSLVVGKRADFTVLSKDVTAIASEEIPRTKVIATFVDGKAVFGTL